MTGIFKPLLIVPVAGIAGFAAHKAVCHFLLNDADKGFYYQLPFLYGMFCLFSIVILAILVVVKRRNINNTGFVFMFLTVLKMVAAYAALYPILHDEAHQPEKLHFFLVFSFFLAVETAISVRILNRS